MIVTENPCVNCLILPRCKSMLIKKVKGLTHFINDPHYVLSDLKDHCSLLHSYLDDTWHLFITQFKDEVKDALTEKIREAIGYKVDRQREIVNYLLKGHLNL